ncbi:glycosyltransferase [Marinomonas sp. S3726]|uniref:glycosyltransferase family 2 protein n=1 Tax=Marinomonas sp. S3726 TaxID=579484 RepID=UPI000697FCD7|nr:glycosyltransferase [Marinomonas sp. S3726]
MKNDPLVTILMNCYNGEKYLREALDSVFSQTYTNWEILFWDNQSTDNSKLILDEYLPDTRIKYFYAPEHTDLGGGRAAAWKYVEGDYLAVLDVDDHWYPEKLALQLDAFKKNDSIGIVISNTEFFSEKLREPLYKEDPPYELGSSELIRKYYISLESVLLSVKHIKRLSEGFSNKFSHIADFDLIVRLSTLSEIVYVPRVLSAWRVHKGSGTWADNEQFNIELLRWVRMYSNNEMFVKSASSLSVLHKRALFGKAFSEITNWKVLGAFKLFKGRGFFDRVKLSIEFIFYFPLFYVFSLYRQYKFERKWWK